MHNWRKGLSWVDTLSSLERHIADFKKGVDIDPKSRASPISTSLRATSRSSCGCKEHRQQFDDRYKEAK
jgi:hypothetical protein